jgi:hypothetical protein
MDASNSIPKRVPLPQIGGTGPKVQVSKHALIKKDMDSGAERVHGAMGARPRVQGAPERTVPGGMIKVRMDGNKSIVLEKPSQPVRQATPGVVGPVGKVVPFKIQHARFLRVMLGRHIEDLAKIQADGNLSPEALRDLTVEAQMSRECAAALEAMADGHAALAIARPATAAAPRAVTAAIAPPQPQPQIEESEGAIEVEEAPEPEAPKPIRFIATQKNSFTGTSPFRGQVDQAARAAAVKKAAPPKMMMPRMEAGTIKSQRVQAAPPAPEPELAPEIDDAAWDAIAPEQPVAVAAPIAPAADDEPDVIPADQLGGHEPDVIPTPTAG